jgi:hypothetical protein
MLVYLLWGAAIILGLLALDRVLLWVESRGWIYYRRSKPGRGASTYHLLEWTAVLDPSMKPAQEILVKEEEQEDESGAPPAPGSGDEPGVEGRPEGPTDN